jgi:glutathione S-transferase
LFGARPCIADAFYAPVVSRFRTYSIPASPAATSYCDAIWAWPALQEWVAAARSETLRAKLHED